MHGRVKTFAFLVYLDRSFSFYRAVSLMKLGYLLGHVSIFNYIWRGNGSGKPAINFCGMISDYDNASTSSVVNLTLLYIWRF
jgi:hypothetical protein